MNNRNNQGFTLVEISIVILIVTILLGFTLSMFPKQQELRKYREAQIEMNSIINYLIAFAQINGRLPCPDTSGNVNGTGAGVIDGKEDSEASGTSCKAYFGYLPRASIGINGDIDSSGRLLDPWGQPYYYHVSNVNASSPVDTAIDLVSPNGVQNEGISNVTPDLQICDDSATIGDDLTCADASSNIEVQNVAAVIISTGKDAGNIISNIQTENTDGLHDGENDKVYVVSEISDASGAEYDDIVRWISPNILFSKMIEACQLP